MALDAPLSETYRKNMFALCVCADISSFAQNTEDDPT